MKGMRGERKEGKGKGKGKGRKKKKKKKERMISDENIDMYVIQLFELRGGGGGG